MLWPRPTVGGVLLQVQRIARRDRLGRGHSLEAGKPAPQVSCKRNALGQRLGEQSVSEGLGAGNRVCPLVPVIGGQVKQQVTEDVGEVLLRFLDFTSLVVKGIEARPIVMVHPFGLEPVSLDTRISALAHGLAPENGALQFVDLHGGGHDAVFLVHHEGRQRLAGNGAGALKLIGRSRRRGHAAHLPALGLSHLPDEFQHCRLAGSGVSLNPLVDVCVHEHIACGIDLLT